MKKLIALCLAVIMVLAMAVTAFADSETVYVTGSSKVFHSGDCENVWRGGRYKTTLKEAHKNRLKPCPECCPVEYDKNDEESQAEYVYVVKGVSNYHNYDCDLLWEEDTWYGTSMTLKTAQAHDLKPCGICHPDELSQKSTVHQMSETGSYHTEDCRMIWKSRFKTTFDALPDDARPCSYCWE